jgi:hypothetical protein
MFSISGLAPALRLDNQLVQSPSFGKDKVFIDDPYADKVSLSSGLQEPALTYQHLAKHNRASTESGIQNEQLEQPDRLTTLMQQVLDGKLGIDRKKLEEIEDKIEALTSKKGELSDAEKSQLEMLQKQKEQLIKEAAKKLVEES